MKTNFLKNLLVMAGCVCLAGLSACGGGGDSDSGSGGDVITASCKVSGNVATVTISGCTIPLGNNIQTAMCVNGSLRLLTGTNITAEDLRATSSLPANTTINGVRLTCG